MYFPPTDEHYGIDMRLQMNIAESKYHTKIYCIEMNTDDPDNEERFFHKEYSFFSLNQSKEVHESMYKDALERFLEDTKEARKLWRK